MDEEEQAKSTSKNLGVPYASFANKILKMEPGQDLEKLIPETFARERAVFPLFLDGETLAITMADPSDKALLDLIRLIAGQEVQPFISSRTQISAAIDASYRP
jgi:type IV pilus assembly protein PilB